MRLEIRADRQEKEVGIPKLGWLLQGRDKCASSLVIHDSFRDDQPQHMGRFLLSRKV